MAGKVTYLVRDGVAIIEIDHPPLNALTASLRADLGTALDKAEADDSVQALVIRGRGRGFGGASDGTDPNPVRKPPTLAALCQRFDWFRKPVVAALHGPVLGTSADLAIAAHYRVAQADAYLGFPEVRVGLLPTGGATQRLPRLVGAEAALVMLQTGRSLGARDAETIGLVDRVVKDKSGVASFALAKSLVAEDRPPRPAMAHTAHTEKPGAYLDVIAQARARQSASDLPVVAEIINCVEAALLLPYDEGLSYAEAARETLRMSEEAAALCHLARAERRAATLPHRLGATPRPLRCLGIIGGDAAGVALASLALDAGLEVTLSATDETQLEDAYARIGEQLDARVASGDETEEEAETRLDRLVMVCGHQAFGSAQVVLDLNSSDVSDATAIAGQLDEVVEAGAVLAFAQPGVPLTEVARATSRPGDVLGLHLPGAIRGAKGAEIRCIEETSRHAAATVFLLGRKLGRLPVRSVDGAAGGGIAGGLTLALSAAAEALVERGATTEDVDAALTSWGLSEGVFEARRRRGLPEFRPEEAPMALAAGGGGRADAPGSAPKRRSWRPETISRVCLAATVNAGARMLETGVAQCPSDIDVVAVHVLGYGRTTGGPMQAGDMAGLLGLRRALSRLGAEAGIGGPPAALLDELIKTGRGFDSLNRS